MPGIYISRSFDGASFSDAGKYNYGNGTDSDYYITGTLILDRDYNFDNLYVLSGGILNTNGYRIYAKTLTRVYTNGRIHCNGNHASGAVGGLATSLTGTLNGSGNGVDGATGGGNNGTTLTQSYGGAGGAGGVGSGGAGGTGGSTVIPVETLGDISSAPQNLLGAVIGGTSTVFVKGGAGGGGGGGNGSANGGASGGGGGVLVINSKRIINDGIISVLGGNGANATNTNTGGGAGGGGGCILANYNSYVGTGSLSAIGGNGGNANGTGITGSAGVAGTVFEPEFGPKAIKGIAAWFRTDFGITLTNGNVSTWADKSGWGRDLGQATEANQPLYVAASASVGNNSKPTIRFDGINDYLQTTSFFLIQPYTTFLVFKLRDYVPTPSLNDIYLDGLSGSLTGNVFGGDSAPRSFISGGTALTTPKLISSGSYEVMTGQFNGVSSSLRENGTERNAGNTGTGNAHGLTVGASATGTRASAIEVSEIIIYERALSSTEMNQIEKYIGRRYGIDIA